MNPSLLHASNYLELNDIRMSNIVAKRFKIPSDVFDAIIPFMTSTHLTSLDNTYPHLAELIVLYNKLCDLYPTEMTNALTHVYDPTYSERINDLWSRQGSLTPDESTELHVGITGYTREELDYQLLNDQQSKEQL